MDRSHQMLLCRAFDITTGEVVWEHRMPAGSQTSPMTYEVGGRQYVVIASGGHTWYDTKLSDYVVAYALPGRSDSGRIPAYRWRYIACNPNSKTQISAALSNV